jgi:putative NIF3 family GTP cyclohydrolase 1 type 2
MPIPSDGVSRREFLLTGATFATAPRVLGQPAAGPLTAQQVIDRIKSQVGIPWRAETVDNVVAGTAATRVGGIATTMMATLGVLQRAAAAGRNMVITHEPTFYSHQDRVDALAEDATYRFKADFVRRHDIVVFHFHDHWHARRPDGIAFGMARELGWDTHADADNPRQFTFPETPLARLARDAQRKLGVRVVRVVGDRGLPVNRVAASWGYASFEPGMRLLARPDVDVLVVGETREWELVEYAQDMVSSGQKKGLIILGHVVSEQAGMKYCAEWLRGFITEVPIEFVPAPEPFWGPDRTA